MNPETIYNYIRVNDRIITGGQPTPAQIEGLAAAGYTAVINLATESGQLSPEEEAKLVGTLGMAYCHIPVDWEAPGEGDFEAFERELAQVTDGKLLIHCAANFRVTAFYSLYAQKNLGWSADQAAQFRATIWEGSDFPVWERFIARMAAKFT